MKIKDEGNRDRFQLQCFITLPGSKSGQTNEMFKSRNFGLSEMEIKSLCNLAVI